ncbi:protease Do-like 7 [Phtheirospermum japonicum]|uniref:Protease Do-like 7 n=1 Tax=Phtheirospermum japonicum TaxID=374723 RepID=A0A830BK64_9LAMI|nr:protease Do-like 7 [Phtheirospermum japonicum]
MERLGSETAMEGMETSMKENLSIEIDPPLKESLATTEDWRKALGKVVLAVVVLRTTACRAFDTDSAGASFATGFIIYKSRGIILTNRHVINPGPVVEEAMFVNREEVSVYPIYRDPVYVNFRKDTYGVFSEPVDINELHVYFEVIKQPMDFRTARKKLNSGAYKSLDLRWWAHKHVCCRSNSQRSKHPELREKDLQAFQETLDTCEAQGIRERD